jgi:hypothetical protein
MHPKIRKFQILWLHMTEIIFHMRHKNEYIFFLFYLARVRLRLQICFLSQREILFFPNIFTFWCPGAISWKIIVWEVKNFISERISLFLFRLPLCCAENTFYDFAMYFFCVCDVKCEKVFFFMLLSLKMQKYGSRHVTHHQSDIKSTFRFMMPG